MALWCHKKSSLVQSHLIFFQFNSLLRSFNFYSVNYEEKTSNDSERLIQHGLVPFNLSHYFPYYTVMHGILV